MPHDLYAEQPAALDRFLNRVVKLTTEIDQRLQPEDLDAEEFRRQSVAATATGIIEILEGSTQEKDGYIYQLMETSPSPGGVWNDTQLFALEEGSSATLRYNHLKSAYLKKQEE